MIRVTVELISARDGIRKTLGVMDICNNGLGSIKRGSYVGYLYRKGQGTSRAAVHREGRVDDFPRKSYVVWRLVLCMLKDMFKDQEK